MPIINDEWIPPSLLISQMGLEEFEKEYRGRKVPVKTVKKDDEQMPALEAKKGFLFGCDPECFVLNTLTGKHVSAEGLIPGTKEAPHKVKHGAVQVDGMAAEFNIDPVDNFKDFNRNIQAVINQLEKMLPERHILDFIPSVVFDEDVFTAAPDKAKELGCSPDFNAWDGSVNPPPKSENPCLRTASGHIHFGWTKGEDLTNPQHIMNCRDLVKQLDWFLGGWSVKVDTDPTRRQLYGRAGACRFKDYGVEYRVLSNFWVTTRTNRLAVWNRMQLAIDAMQKSFYPDLVYATYNNLLINSINSSKLAAELIKSYRYPLLSTDGLASAPTYRRARI